MSQQSNAVTEENFNRAAEDIPAGRVRGRVAWFKPEKGFGFIQREGVADVYVHFSEIISGDSYKTLNPGDLVEFELAPGRKDPSKPRALKVRVIAEGGQ